MVIAHSTTRNFSPLLLPRISEATDSMPDKPRYDKTSSLHISDDDDDDAPDPSLPNTVSLSSFRPGTAPNGRGMR